MIPDKSSIIAAHERIKKYVHHTPVLVSASIDEMAGCSVIFKCENFQKVGAFKARGAMNAVLKLSDAQRSKGVATHSSGNHAQAVARAAKVLGIKSYIVMPRTSPEIKKRGVRGYGGQIFECEPTLAARESGLEQVVKDTGAFEIHPFNSYDVIEGQATCAKEFFEDAGQLDFIVAPVSGGGLLSGTALAAKYFSPSTIVIAGEPSGADDAFRSMKSGKIEPVEAKTIADGLMTSLGEKNFPIIKELVKQIITVTDEEIIAAMRIVWERLKIVAEPSAVVSFAAVMKEKSIFRGKRVGVIISGGNVDLDRASKLFLEGPPK